MLRFIKTLLAVAALASILYGCNDKDDSRVTFSRNSFTVDGQQQTATVTITSPAEWTISSDVSWLSPDPGSGNAGVTTVTIYIGEHTGTTTRNGTLTVSVPSVAQSYTITVSQTSGSGDSNVNQWIYSTLSSNYYWNDAVKAASPDYSLSYSNFLNNLIVNLDGAEDADGTMDGGYYASGSRYVYSYIERTSATRAAGEQTTFGFGVEPVRVSSDNRIWFLVTWVQPGGPAFNAGLKRGMWITKYNNAAITTANYADIFYHIYYLEGGSSLNISAIESYIATTENTYTLNAATMKVSPILYSDVITTGGGRTAGYLVYNEFERGASVGSGIYEFDNELRNVFADFRSQGVQEIILDLRYNHGGYVSSSQVLTSLMARSVSTTNVFAKLQYNSSKTGANPEILHYLNESSAVTGLDRVIILAKKDSASASEMVISSLRGIYGDDYVIHIGEQTEGKNVGMDLYSTTIGGYSYDMWPITFKIYNAKDFADYADGFTPDYRVDEYRAFTTQSGNGIVYEFGDPNEVLLNAALTFVDGGIPQTDTRSRSSSGIEIMGKPGPLPRGGAKVIPSEMEGSKQ